jgi:hypothetical protein
MTPQPSITRHQRQARAWWGQPLDAPFPPKRHHPSQNKEGRKMSANNNPINLEQFIGSETVYRHWSGRLAYTEGVKYLAQKCEAHWLIDAIASWQLSPKVKRDPMLQQIQFWKLRVNPDKSAVLTCERDTDDVAVTQEIEYTNFPLEEIRLYLSNNILLLPSEY